MATHNYGKLNGTNKFFFICRELKYDDFIFCCNALYFSWTVKWVITRDSALPSKIDFSDKFFVPLLTVLARDPNG